jgi:hypothetical protein
MGDIIVLKAISIKLKFSEKIEYFMIVARIHPPSRVYKYGRRFV